MYICFQSFIAKYELYICFVNIQGVRALIYFIFIKNTQNISSSTIQTRLIVYFMAPKIIFYVYIRIKLYVLYKFLKWHHKS